MSILSLRWNGGLSLLEAVEALDKTLPRGRKPNSGTENRERVSLRVFIARAPTLAALLSQIDFVHPWRERVRKMQEEAEPSRQRLTELVQKLEKLEVRYTEREGEITDLRNSLRKANDVVSALEQESKDLQQLAVHDLRQLRAHSRGWLESKLIPILNDALDAASVEKPHVAILKERLAIAIDRINEENQWLKSPG